MSVGQGKSLRAHQHKMHRAMDKTKVKIMGIKERVDAKKILSRSRIQAMSIIPIPVKGLGKKVLD